MSYTPTQWQTGDTITAEKLNNIEQGLFEAVDSVIILNGKAEPFIVTLTPTAADYSGTMDKTVGEIYEALLYGKRIVFKIDGGDGNYIYADCTMQSGNVSAYPSFNGLLIYDARDILIFAYTGASSDATVSVYRTKVYTLTPMS